MLEPPLINNEQIIASLRDQYGLTIREVTFLPLGADANTAVYRVMAEDNTPYFLKLRSGEFDPISVTLPRYLRDQGIRQIIAPLATELGELWGSLDAFKTLLSPFVEGHNGWEVDLTDDQWIEFGATLKAIHSLSAPPELMSRIQRETYSPKWREIVREFLARAEKEVFTNRISRRLTSMLRHMRFAIDEIVNRAERLALRLQANPPESVICHADLHMGNLLITASGDFYIVDWDTVILAPKERDLMFIGGGVGRLESAREMAQFYEGYGETEIDPVALAYYRYERIVEDIAAYCEEILVSGRGNQDRAEGLRLLKSQFMRDAVIDVAYRTDRTRENSQ